MNGMNDYVIEIYFSQYFNHFNSSNYLIVLFLSFIVAFYWIIFYCGFGLNCGKIVKHVL